MTVTGPFTSASQPLSEPATTTPLPDAPLSLPKIDLTPEQLGELGVTLKQLIDINLGNRTAFDRQLDVNAAIMELRKKKADVPWPNAANICTPFVYAAVQEMVSRVNGTVFVPRLLTVRGNDTISGQYAHIGEQYYNDTNDHLHWGDFWEVCTALSIRDGVAYSIPFWELSTHEEIRYANEPVQDDQGQPVMGDDGKPKTQRVAKRLQFVDYDNVRFRAAEARDVVFFPNHAPSKDAADGVAVKVYISEIEARKLVSAGLWDKDITESILAYNSTGQGELSYDPQGYRTYTIAGQIVVADVAVAPPAGIPMTRGPVEMWMVFTHQFSFDEKLGFQEVVAWVHDRSRLCPGVAPFEYWKGRPVIPLSVIPRWNRIYGISLCMVLQGLQEEADTQHNQRLNWTDMLLQPIKYRTAGVRISDEDKLYGPGTEIRVTKPDDYGYISMPNNVQPTIDEEQLLLQYRDMVTGAPQTSGIVSPGMAGMGQQRSARAAQMQAAMAGMMTNLTLRRVRAFIQENFEYAASLTQQYGTNQIQAVQKTAQGPQSFVVPREILGLDYTYGVAGQGGPFDKEMRRQDMMMLVQILLSTPLSQLIQGNVPRLWTLARSLLETFDIDEVTVFIGTMQDAIQAQQAQMEAAQRQQKLAENTEMMKQIFSHTRFPTPTAPRGGQQGQQQQQPAQAPPGLAA